MQRLYLSMLLFDCYATMFRMKPKDLIPPFTREERQLAIHDRIWYVPRLPKAASNYVFTGFHSPEFFGNQNPVHLEFCSGNGLWIFEKAKSNPHLNWVAVELQFKRVRKIWSKMKNSALQNLVVICGEALNAIKHHLPDQCIDTAYINFPDPWPKRRHENLRLVQLPFVHEVARILKPKGEFNLVTDDEAYAKQMREMMNRSMTFQPRFPHPHFATEWPEYGSSYFEDLWREKGKLIYYHSYQLEAGHERSV